MLNHLKACQQLLLW